MTRNFCDKCGAEALSSYSDVTEKIGERREFQLRAVFELVEEPVPCGSIGLSNKRTSAADICRNCQFELLNKLILKISNKPTIEGEKSLVIKP